MQVAHTRTQVANTMSMKLMSRPERRMHDLRVGLTKVATSMASIRPQKTTTDTIHSMGLLESRRQKSSSSKHGKTSGGQLISKRKKKGGPRRSKISTRQGHRRNTRTMRGDLKQEEVDNNNNNNNRKIAPNRPVTKASKVAAVEEAKRHIPDHSTISTKRGMKASIKRRSRQQSRRNKKMLTTDRHMRSTIGLMRRIWIKAATSTSSRQTDSTRNLRRRLIRNMRLPKRACFTSSTEATVRRTCSTGVRYGRYSGALTRLRSRISSKSVKSGKICIQRTTGCSSRLSKASTSRRESQ